MSDRFSGYSLSIGDLDLRQLGDVRLSSSVQQLINVNAGALTASSINVAGAEPKFTVDTTDLATVLGSVDICDGLYTTSDLLLQYQKRVAGGKFEGPSESEHYTLTCDGGGFTRVQSIDARDKQLVRLSLETMMHWDGDGEIITVATGQTIANAPAEASRFFLGPASVNGTAVPGLQYWSVSPGTSYQANYDAGEQYCRQGNITRQVPVIRLGVKDLSAATTFIAAAAAGTLIVYAQKGADCSDRVAKATGQHISISAAASCVNADNLAFSGTEDAACELIFTVKGTLSVSTTATIPI